MRDEVVTLSKIRLCLAPIRRQHFITAGCSTTRCRHISSLVFTVLSAILELREARGNGLNQLFSGANGKL